MTKLTNSYTNCYGKNLPKDPLSLHDILSLHHQLNALLIQEEMLGIALVFVLVVMANP